MENAVQNNRAVYTPETRSLTFLNGEGNPTGGMVGGIAEREHALRRNDLINRIESLFEVKGLHDIKPDILAKYGVHHTPELSLEQLQDLHSELDSCDVAKPVRIVRSQVLSLLSDMGIRPEGDNWDRVNAFLSSPRIAGKVLYKMSVAELRACANRLRMILKKPKVELPF